MKRMTKLARKMIIDLIRFPNLMPKSQQFSICLTEFLNDACLYASKEPPPLFHFDHLGIPELQNQGPNSNGAFLASLAP